MTGNDIRQNFLSYFAGKGHTVVDSSALVPHDDPTLLFTNAGMVQFKRLFTGEEKREYTRAATCQRCVRAGGKHNDLDNVGYTARHHTFFEMLGNFSFGDYFKKDAINYGWDFLTKVLGLSPENLWVSVYEDDDEAYQLWEKIEDLPKGRIIRLGAKDNFWAMGDTGPCGPCSEIHIDQGREVGCGQPDCAVGCDCDRFLELWNLVFMQFERSEDGTMTPLPKPSIDTGMGLERIAAVIQGRHSNYESDLFTPIIDTIARVAGIHYGSNDRSDTAMRVIADHCRTTAFLVADGVLPANEGRGYVLRRIMRRAIRFGRTLGLTRPFLSTITNKVVQEMSPAYPHLNDAVELLQQVVSNEEERFLETLGNGLEMLGKEIHRLKKEKKKIIDGEFIFKLYDTFGFPVDIVRDVSIEEGYGIDEAGYNAAMEAQRAQSRKSWKGGGLTEFSAGLRQLMADGVKSSFVGYATRQHQSALVAIINEQGACCTNAAKGEKVLLVTAETPFYAESGGQIGDQGQISGPAGKARVVNTVQAGDGLILHQAEMVAGGMACGDMVELRVLDARRQAIACNHTATHLLQAALKQMLGDHVKQSGSLVEADRLRFDFTHFTPLSPEEIQKIEAIANGVIRANTRLCIDSLTKEEAIKSGATALFGEKYGDMVRVVTIDSFSKELCGGTHVQATGEIGLLKIVSETGIAAGVRRIEAVSGRKAFARFQQEDEKLNIITGLLRCAPDEAAGRIEKLMARVKELEKEVGNLHAKLSLANLDSLIDSARKVKNIRVVAAQIPLDSAKTMREVGDRVRDKLNSGVAVLGGILHDKVSLLAIVSKDLTGTIQAGNIIKEVAQLVGGGGGGRPDMAQAGGTMPDKLPQALQAVFAIIEKQLP
ncbi:MAG: alanine--tRNA ligase [Proteobacteria bacterium]|nr:alanine--tRNA ligase [Pseudomonadota bacterium]MBU4298021.1 alanine--tRNA ligase [Pseudomonadota bacterium]MCG2749581.1 alanine--tRNA ligase [Desulfobulbaceae bacterium]